MRADQSWLRTVRVVSFTQVAILVGFNFAFPFLPLFIQELGVTDRAELALWTGASIGVSGLAMSLVSPVWGLMADRMGRKAMLVRSVASGSIMLALQSVASSVWQLAAIRVVQGALTGTQTAAAMLLAGIVPAERTGYALGLLSTSAQVGNLIGPVLGGIVVGAIGLRSSFLVGAAVLAVCAVVTVIYVRDLPRAAVETTGKGVRGVLRDIVAPFRWSGLRGALIVGAVVQIVYAGTSGLLAIYVQDLARPPWLTVELAVGLSLALGALAAAATLPALGNYADRHDPRLLLLASLALVAVSLVPQLIVPNAIVFLAARLGIGVGLAGTTSSISVLTRLGAPAGAEGRAFGALASAQNMGWGIGPILGAGLAAVAGIPALYAGGAVVLVLMLARAATAPHWFATPVLAEATAAR